MSFVALFSSYLAGLALALALAACIIKRVVVDINAKLFTAIEAMLHFRDSRHASPVLMSSHSSIIARASVSHEMTSSTSSELSQAQWIVTLLLPSLWASISNTGVSNFVSINNVLP
jgi:hypothetical protein